MKLFFLSSRFRRLNVPGALLLALLQRTPVVRVVAAAESVLTASPVATVLRSAAATVAALGAVHSMAGATPLVPNSGTATGVTVTVGTAVSVAYTVTGTETKPQSWKVSGAFPPGLNFSGLTAAGTVNVQTLQLGGTPTTAGSYQLSIIAYEGPNATIRSTPTYTYTVTVNDAAPTAPTITTQPQAKTVTVGGTVSLSVTATGSPAPTYQWKKDGANVTSANATGATSATLTFINVQASDAGTYTVVVTNSVNSVTSSGAVLTVNPSTTVTPTFTTQPTSQTMATGSTVVFSAAATNATAYQWQKNGTSIAGATGTLLVLSNVTAADAGNYTLVATGTGATATSNAATLAVTTASAVNTGHLRNLSVRTTSGTGDQLLNVGFALGGNGTSGAKPLLVRVTGPALAGFGVGGTMADPTLTIQPLGQSTIVASNDNWGGDATVVSTSAAVGAFPLNDTASKDAALVASLSGGTYTAVAAGKNNTTGIVLTEIYDATPSASFSAATPRLTNVSARAQVGTGDGVLIAGFEVSGTTSRTLLIRATGPALASFGVGGTLADPKVEVYLLGGAKLYENDNWGGLAQLATAAGSVGAFPISDVSSKDAVLLVTLPPGVYTAQVSGVNGGTGVALVEVYDVP